MATNPTKRHLLTPDARIRRQFESRLREADTQAYKRALAWGVKAELVSRAELLKRDGHTCYLCGGWLSIHDLHIEHIIPVSRGGEHTPGNLKVAHKTCNLRKGKRLPSEIVDLAEWGAGGTVAPELCVICNKPFELPYPSLKGQYTTCSPECRRQRRSQASTGRRRPDIKVDASCEGCGKTFRVNPAELGKRRLCSKECFWVAVRAGKIVVNQPSKKTGLTVNCERCGGEYYVCKARLSKTRFCSEKCRTDALIENLHANTPSHKVTRLNKTCARCGSVFTVPPSLDYRKYCGAECFAKAITHLAEKACETCGKSFRPKNGASSKYCSRACYFSSKRRQSADTESCR
jgi:ribosomal protein S27AE